MDKHQIGVNAGKVWKLLNDNKRWSYCDLKRASESVSYTHLTLPTIA